MELHLLDRLSGSNVNTWRRDLAALLNTRRAEHALDPKYEQATNSLLMFGMPDFTNYNLNSDVDRERLRSSIERAIRQFEPRLTRVQVALEQQNPFDPVLRLRVEAELRSGKTVESVDVDGMLDRASRHFTIDGVRS